jgi:serine/threonine-protein kinase
MLSGRRAFTGDSAASVIASIIGQDPAPVSCIEQPGLENLVNKRIAKDPEQRWQSAADLRDDLLWLPTKSRPSPRPLETDACYGPGRFGRSLPPSHSLPGSRPRSPITF